MVSAPDMFDSLEELLPPRHADYTPEQIRQAVLDALVEGHEAAKATMGEPHERWARHRRLNAGRWSQDLTAESAILNEIYIPKLAELITQAIAGELPQLVPDPQSADFAGVESSWPGLEADAAAGEALLRQKLRIMTAPDAGRFYQIMHLLMQDHRVTGQLLAVVTHDVFDGDLDDDELSEGPLIERLDPLNWYPWSRSVDSVRQCAHTFHAPLPELEAERIPYLDPEELRKLTPGKIDRTEPTISDASATSWDEVSPGPADFGWRRTVFIGPLPWAEIARKLGEPEWTREDVRRAVASVFEFPEGKDDCAWWTGEWFEDTYLARLVPYPLDLPAGECPLVHEPFDKINGELLGRGVYDGMSWIERLYNEYNRLLLQLGRFAAEPPVVVYRHLLEEDWFAEHEMQETFLMPGERIPLRDGLVAPGVEPFKILEMGVGPAMQAIRTEMDRLEIVMRADAQVTHDYSGQSQTRTATQAQNNLLQSRSVESHRVRLGENGWVLSLIERCYLVARQVLRLRGESQPIPVSAGERQLQVYEVAPEMLRSLAYFRVTVSGSSAPQNRTYQVAQLEALFGQLLGAMANPALAPLIQADLRWYLKTILDALGVRGKEGAFTQYDALAPALANVTAIWGQRGVGALPEGAREQLTRLVQAGVAQQPGELATMLTPTQPAGAPAAPRPSMPSAAPGMTGVG